MTENSNGTTNQKIVYTYGVFDLLHIGHIHLLEEAKALGDRLVVGVFTDAATESFKRKPIIPQEHRLKMLQALSCVDEAVYQDHLLPHENLRKIRPHVLAKGPGANWEHGKEPPGADVMRELGGKVVIMEYHPFTSTSKIIEDIWRSQQNVEIAATVSPITPELEGIAIARWNGAFGTFDQMAQTLSPYKEKGIAILLDLPRNRKKHRTNQYTDEELVEFAKKFGVSYVAVSYAEHPDDLKYDHPMCAKIETRRGYESIDDIAKKADIILVDRRDLATSIGIENVPRAIEHIIDAAHKNHKKVILASEFLLNMTGGGEPTLAEVQNVRSAAAHRADYLLLSEETAIGKDPQYIVEFVKNVHKDEPIPVKSENNILTA